MWTRPRQVCRVISLITWSASETTPPLRRLHSTIFSVTLAACLKVSQNFVCVLKFNKYEKVSGKKNVKTLHTFWSHYPGIFSQSMQPTEVSSSDVDETFLFLLQHRRNGICYDSSLTCTLCPSPRIVGYPPTTAPPAQHNPNIIQAIVPTLFDLRQAPYCSSTYSSVLITGASISACNAFCSMQSKYKYC